MRLFLSHLLGGGTLILNLAGDPSAACEYAECLTHVQDGSVKET